MRMGRMVVETGSFQMVPPVGTIHRSSQDARATVIASSNSALNPCLIVQPARRMEQARVEMLCALHNNALCSMAGYLTATWNSKRSRKQVSRSAAAPPVTLRARPAQP